jgi:hypothetical protein
MDTTSTGSGDRTNESLVGGAVRACIRDQAHMYHGFGDDMVIVTFHGKRITGRYVNVRTQEKIWLNQAPEPPE